MTEDDSELWAFAAGVYGEPGSEKACLRLQDEFGADVVLVLFLVWLGLGGKAVCGKELEALRGRAGQWQDSLVKPLRQMRRQLKTIKGSQAGEIYSALKSSELAAERLELQSLLGAAASLNFAFDLRAGTKAAAMANIENYFAGNASSDSWPRIKESAELIVESAERWGRRRAGK